MAKDQAARNAALREQFPCVDRPMMRPAHAGEVVRVVSAAFGAGIQVVYVDPHAVPAPRHDAAAVVATYDLAPDRGRDGLRCASRRGRRTHVGIGTRRADVLRVTFGHLDHLASDFDELAAARLLSAPARRADIEGHLVACAPGILRSPKRLASQKHERGVIVERLSRVTPELGERFPKERQGLARDLEPQNVAAHLRILRVLRPVSRLMSRDELLDLAGAPSARGLESLALGLRNRNASELAHRRPGELPVAKRLAELGKLFEGFGNAELFEREAG